MVGREEPPREEATRLRPPLVRELGAALGPEIHLSNELEMLAVPIAGLREGLVALLGARRDPAVLVVEFVTEPATSRDVASIVAQLRVALDAGLSVETIAVIVDKRELLRVDRFTMLSDVRTFVAALSDPRVFYELQDDAFHAPSDGVVALWDSVSGPDMEYGHAPPFLEADALDLLFGHFSLGHIEGVGDVHTNVIPHLLRVAASPQAISEVRRGVELLASTQQCDIAVSGVFAEELARIALGVVEGDTERIVGPPGEVPGRKSSGLIIIADLLGRWRGIEGLIDGYRNDGWSNVGVLALCGTTDFVEQELGPTSTRILCSLPAIGASFPSAECPYCASGATPSPQPGQIISPRDYVWDPTVLEPKEFWDLISWSNRFAEFGHWRSERTDNHFTLRILAGPVFETFGHSIALRMRAALTARGVLPGWVHGLLCTDGEESGSLAESLRQVLSLPPDAILRVPRVLLRESSASGLGERLSTWLADDRNVAARNISGKNILLLDQAAHHFATYSALRRVANHLRCTSLAFLVLVSRATNPEEVAAVLNDLHFAPLYIWSNSAWTRFTCPCGVAS